MAFGDLSGSLGGILSLGSVEWALGGLFGVSGAGAALLWRIAIKVGRTEAAIVADSKAKEVAIGKVERDLIEHRQIVAAKHRELEIKATESQRDVSAIREKMTTKDDLRDLSQVIQLAISGLSARIDSMFARRQE
jgi:hypothetical protein